ncbi:hypothetical protein POM88_000181 [Heracleum sosnowskyi]|uniref:Uncharacterized protein n=1 Tax=Heracleum sosnowskyi TaxID=360622 RepID=A0AAD8N9I0_9APIA|nr:hypothetical protein POM88_000181 [Heracleum sosnowskyi]
MITAQAGFGYQQELVLGMRPGDGPMPMVQQGQERQRPGGRRGAQRVSNFSSHTSTFLCCPPQLFMDLQFPNGQLTYVSGECISTSAYSGEMTFSYSRKEEEVSEIANLFNRGKKKKKDYIAS